MLEAETYRKSQRQRVAAEAYLLDSVLSVLEGRLCQDLYGNRIQEQQLSCIQPTGEV